MTRNCQRPVSEMDENGTTFVCPKCGHSLTCYLDPTRVVCWHWGTPHDLRGKSGRPSVMKRQARTAPAPSTDIPLTAGQKAAATRRRNLLAAQAIGAS